MQRSNPTVCKPYNPLDQREYTATDGDARRNSRPKGLRFLSCKPTHLRTS